MNREDIIFKNTEHKISKWGGTYILLVQALAQLINYGMVIVWFSYNYLVSEFTPGQYRIFLLSSIFFITLGNIILLLLLYFATPQARQRLNYLYKNTQPTQVILGKDDFEINAWKETVQLPGTYTIAGFGTYLLSVVLPVVLLMIRVSGIDAMQVIHITLSGVFSGTIVIMLSSLVFDLQLKPARQVLLPKSLQDQRIESFHLRTIPYLMTSFIVFILVSVVMIGLLGYQKIINVTLPGVDIQSQISQFQSSIILISLLLLVSGIIFARSLSQSLLNPVKELITTIDAFTSGSVSYRAQIIASNETAQLSIRLNQLLERLQTAQTGLQTQVNERTDELLRRTLQLQASAQVAREAASVSDVNTLLSKTVDLIAERFNFYHAGIFLLDEDNEYAVLRAASSEGGKIMLENGHRLPIGLQGIVGAVAYENRAHVAMDVGVDSSFAKNPALPLTRAEAAFPLSIRNNVIGVLDIQSTSIDVFSQSDIELLQTLADQIALAIQNAHLIEEARTALRQIEASNIDSVRHVWGERARQQKHAFRYTPLGVSPVTTPAEVKNTSEEKRTNIPITLRGQKIGNILIQRKDTSKWNEADRSLAVEVANQIGLALENARLLEEAQQRVAHEQSISDLASKLSRSLDPQSLMQTVVKELHQLPNVEEVSVFIGSPDKEPADSNNPPEEEK